jgi:DNA (cytosine-5)-methyltransferase 1
MIFATVCSGLESASLAWTPLGWTPAWFAETDPFCNEILQTRFPSIPNLGDFPSIESRHLRQFKPIDILAAGTPCQSFSQAGKRKGLSDPRGNLTLEFARLAGRIEPRPKWIVWENVPGVLSQDGGRAFGAFLGEMGKLGYRLAWRVLDAQYFGVPQRRRRVFLVGYSGREWKCPGEVLFERGCLQGNPGKGGKARQASSRRIAPCLSGSGRGTARAGESRGQDPLIVTHSISPCLQERVGKGPDSDCTQALVITNSPIPLLEVGKRTGKSTTDPRAGMGIGNPGDPMFTLQSGAQHGIGSGSGVRRLTPRECERLQSIPDDWTQIPWRGRPADKCPDGPRYRAIGNAMAVPVMAWIGERIMEVERKRGINQ